MRWHSTAFCRRTRAYCFSDHCFKDFLLGRILGSRNTRPSEVDAGQDADWNTRVTLEVGPHSGLSDAQKKVIALDYGMRDGKARITVPKAMLYYTLKRLGLDTDPVVRKPADQQIVLLNRDVVDDPGQ